MLVVTLPMRAAAMVVVASAASGPPPSLGVPLELVELEVLVVLAVVLTEAVELVDPCPPVPLDVVEPLELPEVAAADWVDEEPPPQANRRADEIDAAAREAKAREWSFIRATLALACS
jgi:hypothetical protein